MAKFLKKHWKWAAGLVAVALIAFFGVQHYLKKKSALPKGIASGNGRIESTQVDVSSKLPLRVKEVLASEAVSEEAFRGPESRLHGSRRPYRVPLRDASIEVEDDGSVRVRFSLPPGSFGTVVLDELMKEDVAAGPGDGEEGEGNGEEDAPGVGDGP